MPFRRPDSKKWYITVGGRQQSSGTEDFAAAEALEGKLKKEKWEQQRMGVKPAVSWLDAVKRRVKLAKDALADWETERQRLDWWTPLLGEIDDIKKITAEMLHNYIIETPLPLAAKEGRRNNITLDPKNPTSENTTANKYVRVVTTVLNQEAEREFGRGAKAQKFIVYPEPEGREFACTPLQALMLAEQLPQLAGRQWLYGCVTMHRRHNVTHLRWDMIDMKTRSVSIDSSETKKLIKIHVPLCDTAMAILWAQWNARDRKGRSLRHPTWVFPYRNTGEPVKQVVTRCFREARELVKLPEDCVFHSSRHTGNTWLKRAKVPKEIRKQLGGWSVGSEAIDGYGHLDVEDLREYAAKFDEAIARGLVELEQLRERGEYTLVPNHSLPIYEVASRTAEDSTVSLKSSGFIKAVTAVSA